MNIIDEKVGIYYWFVVIFVLLVKRKIFFTP